MSVADRAVSVTTPVVVGAVYVTAIPLPDALLDRLPLDAVHVTPSLLGPLNTQAVNCREVRGRSTAVAGTIQTATTPGDVMTRVAEPAREGLATGVAVTVTAAGLGATVGAV